MRKIRREVTPKIQKSFEPRIRPRQGKGVTGSADVTNWSSGGRRGDLVPAFQPKR
jgi:hypothetical protein